VEALSEIFTIQKIKQRMKKEKSYLLIVMVAIIKEPPDRFSVDSFWRN